MDLNHYKRHYRKD